MLQLIRLKKEDSMPAICEPAHSVSRLALTREEKRKFRPYMGRVKDFTPATPAEYRVVEGVRVLVLIPQTPARKLEDTC